MKKFDFLKNISILNIQGNQQIKLNEIELVKYFSNAKSLQELHFECIFEMNGLCFLSIIPKMLRTLRFKNVSFSDRTYLINLLFGQEDKLLDFEYTIYPDVMGYQFPYKFSQFIMQTLINYNTNLKSLSIFLNAESVPSIVETITKFKDLHTLNIVYNPNYDISDFIKRLPSLHTLRRLSIYESVNTSKVNYINHYYFETYLSDCKTLHIIKLDINGLLNIKMNLKNTNILCAYKKERGITSFSSLPIGLHIQ